MSYTEKEYFAPAPTTIRGQPVRLSASPQNDLFTYASGKAIIIRSLADPSKSSEYTGHTQATTMARFSSSGYYIASGDAQGNVRIWDSKTHTLKSQFRPISDRINDLGWDHESQRVMAVGDGKTKFGHVFLYDSGNTVGCIEGHSRRINACALRQRRPFRAVTCADDGKCVFYFGAPYKYNRALTEHKGFVHDVRYSPDDEMFVSVGADRCIFLYDGKTGDAIRQVAKTDKEGAHTGSIFAVAWSPDAKMLVTSAADRTCKFWDVATDALIGTVRMGDEIGDQQVGNLWAGEHIISLSLSGNINKLQVGVDAPVQVITGHQKTITAAVLTADKVLYTGSYDGKLCTWDFSKDQACGSAVVVAGSTGGARLDAAATDASSGVVALGFMDNSLRLASDSKITASVALPAEPRSLAMVSLELTLAVLLNDTLVAIASDGQQQQQCAGILITDSQSAPKAVAHSNGLIAVGFHDGTVRTYTLRQNNNGNTGSLLQLLPTGTLIEGHSREITVLEFSPQDAVHLASGDAGGKILVSQAKDGALVTARWGSHTARIYGIAWSPSGLHVASASLDGHLIIWSIERPLKNIQLRNAHLGGATSVHYLSDTQVVSTGTDGGVKVWEITNH
ncbi:WD40 repeat-like protein [Kickxella alabastrina]|uniref:WD40 repeat-like protein n=1 Tax=Kickxella alabastrina TaxID=61397 RepID=A0ACC1IP72_9FUNG|nr:WD40 repeat-like protein [Kickxella alabastrina]